MPLDESYIQISFPHPIGGAGISEALMLTRAGFAVTGFIVQDGAVTAVFTGVLSAESVKLLTATFEEINNLMSDEALNANMFGELVEGMAISFPEGIPLAALESAFVYVQAGVPVIGFAVKNGVYEPLVTGPLTQELIDAIAQQFTIEL